MLAVHTIVRKTADFSKKTQHVHQATDRIVIKLLKSKPRFLFLKWDRKLNNLTPDIQCIMVVSFLFQVHFQLQCRRNFKTIASKRERVFLSDNTNCFSCAHPSSKCATTKMHSQQCHGPVIERFLLALEINHRIRIHIDSGGMAQCEMHNTNINNRNRKFEKKNK